MKPILTASKSDVTTVEFYPLELWPQALWMVQKLNGTLVQEGAVTRSVVEAQDPSTLAVFFTAPNSLLDARASSVSGVDKSLPLNSIFWPVLRTKLSDPNAELWPDIHGSFRVSKQDADNPLFILLHKSGWDHQVWGVDRKPLMAPLRLKIWGIDYHLNRLGEHLTTVHGKHFSDFEVEPNPVWQNHEISGRSLGHVTFDPTGFDFPKKVSRSISGCEEAFFRLPSYAEEGSYDPFGVRAFLTKRKR